MPSSWPGLLVVELNKMALQMVVSASAQVTVAVAQVHNGERLSTQPSAVANTMQLTSGQCC
jgi:hypothetical protein